MFENNLYIPILKGKEGELGSLDEIPIDFFEKFNPLIEVAPIPYDYENETVKYTIDKHIEGLADRVNIAVKQGYFYIDFNLIEDGTTLEDGREPISKLFEELRDLEANSIPVTSLSRTQEYQEAVKEIVNQDRNGVCFRLTEEELSSDDYSEKIHDLVDHLDIPVTEIDLIIDFKDISRSSNSSVILLLKTLINGVIDDIEEWRTLNVAMTSFPETMSEINRSSIEYLERGEIEIFETLRNSKIKRKPTFSDYSISSTAMVDIDPRIMNMSASIRYTTVDSWLIIKGMGVRTPNSGGFKQFHNLSQAMLQISDYDGRGYSWGDNFIHECANHVSGTGNATTWRKVGNTHHITKMLDVISNLP